MDDNAIAKELETLPPEVIQRIDMWWRLRDRFLEIESASEDKNRLGQLEADAAWLLIKHLVSGGLGGTDPTELLRHAGGRLGESLTGELCRHLRAVATRATDDQLAWCDKSKWEALSSDKKSTIWRVLVCDCLLDIAKCMDYTDLKLSGSEDALPARLSAIACTVLFKLDLDCVKGIVKHPFKAYCSSCIQEDDEGPRLSIDLDRGSLKYDGKEEHPGKSKGLTLLNELNDRFGYPVRYAELALSGWGKNHRPLGNKKFKGAIARQISNANSLLKLVTEDLQIKPVPGDGETDGGYHLIRVTPGN